MKITNRSIANKKLFLPWLQENILEEREIFLNYNPIEQLRSLSFFVDKEVEIGGQLLVFM